MQIGISMTRNVDPEILIKDEVSVIGDALFRQYRSFKPEQDRGAQTSHLKID